MTDTHAPAAVDVDVDAEPSAEDLLILAANHRPATMTAVSSLAEDTVFAAGLAMMGGPEQWTLFSNPYSGGMEELLFIDANQWLNHAWRPVGAYAADLADDHGWRVSRIGGSVTGVHAVLHPNGAVYAFATTTTVPGQEVPGRLIVWELGATTNSLPTWNEIVISGWPESANIARLFTQYLGDPGNSPVVFAIPDGSPDEEGTAYSLLGCWDNVVQPWEPRDTYSLAPGDAERLFAIGYDDASMAFLRMYSVRPTEELWRTSVARNGDRAEVKADVGWEGGIGGFAGPTGYGAVGVGGGDKVLRTHCLYDNGSSLGTGVTTTVSLAEKLYQLRVWQDSSGLMHVYGIGLDKNLHVLHQLGWHPYQSGLPAAFPPQWDVVVTDDKNKLEFAALRPLLQGVFTYSFDAFPDQMPSQVVFQAGPSPGEAFAICTQQIGTSYWDQENIRVKAPDNAAPYSQHRYQSKITVKDGYGTPIPGCEVMVTSDGPVDLVVGGRAYRVRPTLPATLKTDFSGSLTVKVPAKGLSTPNLHFAVSGLANALTIQPAAELHKFLSGAGTLPGHLTGFTAAALTDAKLPDGKTPLFPILHPKDSDAPQAAWPPDAADVVAWCQAAFAASAGGPMPASLRAGLPEEAEVLAFSFQTHDRSRPALEVFSDHAALEAFREEQGIAYDSEWFGDLIEGLRASVAKVSQVVVDVANSGIAVLVELVPNTSVWLHARWDDAVSAAHAVEAILASLGAALADVLDWLSWPFGFADVWATKKAMETELTNFIKNIKTANDWMRKAPTAWADKADQAIDDALTAFAGVFGEQYTGRFESPGLHPQMQTPINGLNVQDLVRGGPANWLMELLGQASYDDPGTFESNPVEKFLTDLAALPEWLELAPDLEVVGQALYDLFDWSNPNTAKTILVQALLEVLGKFAKAGVQFAAAALQLVCNFVDDIVDQLAAWGALPVQSPTLQNIYNYIQKQAGVTGTFETLTFADLAILMGAYPATAVYKMVFGVAPFAVGASSLAELQLPDLGGDAGGLGGSEAPANWSALRLFQGYFVVMMCFDGPFDIQVNNIAISKARNETYWAPPKPYWVAWALNHVLAYGIGDYPAFWGNDFPPEDWNDPSEWGPTVSWWASAAANLADLGCACEWGTFVGLFEKNDAGPGFYMSLGVGRIFLSGLRYDHGPDKGYPFAVWNCAINVTSFESAATGILRQALFDKKDDPNALPYWIAVVTGKSVVDVICDEFAGFASLVQIIYEDWDRPSIAPIKFSDATVGEVWEGLLQGAGGMTPYAWSLTVPKNPPQGTIPGFPDSLWHLEESTDDPSLSRLTGTPVKGNVGTYVFYVRLEDDYGPGFKYRTDELVYLTVKPAEEA